jgi:uncharacterized phage protein gp47/JayE
MATVPERKNTLVLARDFRDKVSRRTGITDFDSDSKTEALISVFVEQVIDARNAAASAFYANQISTAAGEQLDQIGQDLGVPRFAETFAFSEARDQNVAFYTDGSTFGAINGGADIIVPAGTAVYSNVNENDLGAKIVFKTTANVTLPAAGVIGFVGVRAEVSGSQANLGGGMLINHSFTGYTAGTGLGVVNFFAILNGRSRESDRNYRYRLSRRYDTLVSSNNSKLHLEALRVPGVLDTRIIPGYYGIGTVGVVVLGAENQATTQSVRAVQARLNSIQGPSSRMHAVPATSVYFDIQMEVRPVKTLTAAQKRQFELATRRTIRNYLRSQGIRGTVGLKDLAAELTAQGNSAIRLTSLGRAEEIFDTVYVRKGPSSGSTTERDLLKNSYYSLDEDEYADLGTLSVRYL